MRLAAVTGAGGGDGADRCRSCLHGSQEEAKEEREGSASPPELKGVALLLVESPVEKLDLHGMNARQAETRVRFFLQRHATTSRGRVVHIITGKGTRSQGEPVLPELVREMLQDDLGRVWRNGRGFMAGAGSRYGWWEGDAGNCPDWRHWPASPGTRRQQQVSVSSDRRTCRPHPGRSSGAAALNRVSVAFSVDAPIQPRLTAHPIAKLRRPTPARRPSPSGEDTECAGARGGGRSSPPFLHPSASRALK